MALLLNCESLGKSYALRLLFKEISIAFDENERTGLIGPNGSGKSTLMKILAGQEHADTGQITSRRNLRLAYLPQEDTFPPGATVESVMFDALADEHLEDHKRHARSASMLGRIGFARFDQPADDLSGGWRKRLAIAREMVKHPELLLLDEPTNHLDVEGILWLEKVLKNAPFAFIVVSHDRYFLENVTNRIVELNPAYPHGYLSSSGTYTQFLVKRQEFLEAQSAQERALASRVRREIEWLRRGAKARTTKAKGRIEQAGRMMEDLADLKQRNATEKAAEIDMQSTGRQTRKLLVASGISKSMGGKQLIRNLDLVLSPGSRLGLLGPNGSGKTTLLRMLAGELPPDQGTIRPADGLKIVRFDQSRQQLDKAQTLKAALSPGSETVVHRGTAMHVSGWAQKFLFRREQLDLPLADLSGGEQARVLIARLMLQPADLLILDEPTNDLDIDTLEVLEESLEEFPGALVLVTHDRFMLDRVSTGLLGLDGKGTAGFYADFAQWERAREQARQADAPAKPAAPRPAAPSEKPKPRRLNWNEQREMEAMEANITQAEAELEKWQQRMNDPQVLSNRDQLHDVCERFHAAQERVTSLYARWQELEAKTG